MAELVSLAHTDEQVVTPFSSDALSQKRAHARGWQRRLLTTATAMTASNS